MDRPILFSGEMVRAILAGHKTQTRRVIKLPTWSTLDWADFETDDAGKPVIICEETGCLAEMPCPYGQPGDRLWVRETWIPDPPQDDTWDYYAFTDGVLYNFDNLPNRFKKPKHIIYRASWNGIDLRWRPSIFMPRWASRLTLEVVSVRVERVQEISNPDAQAEGVGWWQPVGGEKDYRLEYSMLWNRINAKRGYSWDSNPWAWVIEFKRCDHAN